MATKKKRGKKAMEGVLHARCAKELQLEAEKLAHGRGEDLAALVRRAVEMEVVRLKCEGRMSGEVPHAG